LPLHDGLRPSLVGAPRIASLDKNLIRKRAPRRVRRRLVGKKSLDEQLLVEALTLRKQAASHSCSGDSYLSKRVRRCISFDA